MKRPIALTIAACVMAASAGACASMALKDNDVALRASTALGMEQGTFTVSDRTDQGLETRFKVTTNAGQVYNCSMAVSVSVLGSVPSDAICTPLGGAPATQCNALLKAAGKCPG